MSDAQNKIKSLYQEIKGNEKKKKAINAVLKEAFEKTKEYQDLMEEMKTLRARKKEIEISIRSEYTSEFNELDDLKIDIKDTKMVLSDLIWNELIKNVPVEVIDEYDNHYVPLVSVSLKRAT